MTERNDLNDLAAAYALGALDPEEARAFEAHLATSETAQRELAHYREVGALLADGVGTGALDPQLKDRVLARVAGARDRRLTPSAGSAPARPATHWWGWGLAASLLLAAGAGTAWWTQRADLAVLRADLSAVQARLSTREATLAALLQPGVELYRLSASGDNAPGIQFFWDRRRDTAILHAYNLPPAPEGRAYQLWLVPAGGTPIPSRVFNSELDGHALVERIPVPGEGRYGALAVTEEPAGGSPQPTTPILLLANIAS